MRHSTLPRNDVPVCEVDCYIDGRQDFYHLSKVHAGLMDLHEQGEIVLRFRYRPSARRNSQRINVPLLEIRWNHGRDRCRVEIDLGDRAGVYNEGTLRSSDVYLKRNLLASSRERESEKFSSLVLPFGLNFGCRRPGQRRTVLLRAIPHLGVTTLLHPRRELGWLKKRCWAARQFIGVLPVSDYEQSPTRELRPIVFSQFVVWGSPPGGKRNVEEEVNKPRVELVRTLKKELGASFVGGLAPTEYARRHYPDLLSPVSSRRDAFIREGKTALIGVASVPCVDTGSFKLGEFLAASRCIVSPRIAGLLPEPLIEGKHYLSYDDAHMCVERCVELLENPDQARRMRFENSVYYREQVAPRAHMKRIIVQCIDLMSRGGTVSPDNEFAPSQVGHSALPSDPLSV